MSLTISVRLDFARRWAQRPLRERCVGLKIWTVRASVAVVNAGALREVIAPATASQFVLVSRGLRAGPPRATALSVRPEALNPSGGKRFRDTFTCDGEQPAQPIEMFHSAPPRQSGQMTRQPPAMVSAHWTENRLVAHVSCSNNRAHRAALWKPELDPS